MASNSTPVQTRKLMISFRFALSSWRNIAIQTEDLLENTASDEELRKQRQVLQAKINALTTIINELLLETDDGNVDNEQLYSEYESAERETHYLYQKISSVLREGSYRTRSYCNDGSNSEKSTRSTSSAEHMKATMDAAVLKTKLKHIELEARKKVELEKIQVCKELDIAQAKINAILEIEQHADDLVHSVNSPVETHEYVEKYLESLPDKCPSVSISLPEVVPDNSDYKQKTNDPPPALDRNNEPVSMLAKIIADQVSLNRLPVPEPGIFCGDPLQYPAWKCAFNVLVSQRGISPHEQIHYLKRYLGGSAKETVESFFLLSNEDAFTHATKVLDDRYGDSYLVSDAFRNKLNNWPKIHPSDGAGLRKLADYLTQCSIAMNTVEDLKILNDSRENRNLLLKLPDWITTRWGRIVSDWRSERMGFPPFVVFVKFLQKEADIACDPVTSLQSLRHSEKQNQSDKSRSSHRRTGFTFSTKLENPDTSKDGKFVKSCLYCERNFHEIHECRNFASLSQDKKQDYIMRRGLCFACLKHGHKGKDCIAKQTCKTCFGKHPTSLHIDYPNNTQRRIVSHMSGMGKSDKCSMIVPVWISTGDNPQNRKMIYALLDTQSDSTFISENACEALGLQGTEVKLSLSTMTSENQVISSRKIEGLTVCGQNSTEMIKLPPAYTRRVIPANRSHIPTPEIARQWPYLEGISSELLPLQDFDIGLLIGYNCPRALAPTEVIPPVNDGPYGQKTVLGWGVVGIVNQACSEMCISDVIGVSHQVILCEIPNHLLSQPEEPTHVSIALRSSVKEIISSEQVIKMMEIDFSERKSKKLALSQEDKRFLSIMTNDIQQTSSGHYEMPLPFKDSMTNLPKNKPAVMHRLNQLKNRFEKDVCYQTKYTEFMNRMIENHHAERVPEAELDSEQVWYIPHHGVSHPKKPDKLRVVFDCSAKYKGQSLNTHLLQGPDLSNSLLGVLCRFRQEKIAFTCDIEQMFHQFRVKQDCRDFFRFLWWEKGDYRQDPVEFRMCVHLFGAVSSPGCANFGLKQIASDNQSAYGSDAATFIDKNFYVDDGLKSTQTVEEALNLIDNTGKLCSEGSLRLHKFMSNSKEVLNSLPPESLAKDVCNRNLHPDVESIEHALGVAWCIESDTFQFRISLKDQPLTRRGILSTICSVYDPLGLIAPVLLTGKEILQQMCRDKADWDSPLPETLRAKWEKWRSQLFLLQTLKIPRCVKPQDFGKVKDIEMHHFSDASSAGYGQCSYLRLVDEDENIHCTFLMGKARVAPIKPVTIPRLELTAAVVSVKISEFLQSELEYKNVKEIFWSDSKVTLAYIANEDRRFHVFVANQVQQIRDHTEPSQWRYVSSEDNPADDCSRGLPVDKFIKRSRWFHGPEFLWANNYESSASQTGKMCSDLKDDPEVKTSHCFQVETKNSVGTFETDRLNRFSDWHKVKNAVAICLKYKSILLNRVRKNIEPVQSHITVENLNEAETEIVRTLQSEVFREEIKTLKRIQDKKTVDEYLGKSNPLYPLDPIIDVKDLLRIGGRIKRGPFHSSVKHPVILPKDHHLTQLVIRHFHERTAHQGRGITLNEIRANGFWIIGGCTVVSKYIFRCVMCRKLRSSTQEPKMADLPEDRLEATPPFCYCGVDYFGPWYIKEGRKEVKRYGVVFTCLTSRAIHLETANSLETSSFINILRRFISIRGPIRHLRSDRGTNFIGAETELRKCLEEQNENAIKCFLSGEGCDYFPFVKNFPSSSHMGGVWESQIRTVRNVLAGLLKQNGSQLDDESLRTLMAEAAAIVNSRPLTTNDINDPDSLEPLTPNHLLTMKSKIILPPPGNFQRADLYSRKRWRRVQFLLNVFWSRWRKEYLQTLQSRKKWVRNKRNLAVNDIVLLKDDDLPRGSWLLARIIETFESSDGHVRKVKLLLGNKSTLERPVHKVVLIIEGNSA